MWWLSWAVNVIPQMQRLHPMGVQMLRPGPTHSVSSASASVQSHLSQVLKTHRDKMEFDPDQLRGLKQLVQKITGPRMISPTPGRLVPHPPTTPQPQTPAATRVGRGRAARRRPQVSKYLHTHHYITACVAKPEWHVLSHHTGMHIIICMHLLLSTCTCTCMPAPFISLS